MSGRSAETPAGGSITRPRPAPRGRKTKTRAPEVTVATVAFTLMELKSAAVYYCAVHLAHHDCGCGHAVIAEAASNLLARAIMYAAVSEVELLREIRKCPVLASRRRVPRPLHE